jgi:hypothetical protein
MQFGLASGKDFGSAHTDDWVEVVDGILLQG